MSKQVTSWWRTILLTPTWKPLVENYSPATVPESAQSFGTLLTNSHKSLPKIHYRLSRSKPKSNQFTAVRCTISATITGSGRIFSPKAWHPKTEFNDNVRASIQRLRWAGTPRLILLTGALAAMWRWST